MWKPVDLNSLRYKCIIVVGAVCRYATINPWPYRVFVLKLTNRVCVELSDELSTILTGSWLYLHVKQWLKWQVTPPTHKKAQLQIGGSNHVMLTRQRRKYSKTKDYSREKHARSWIAFGIPNSLWLSYSTVITCTLEQNQSYWLNYQITHKHKIKSFSIKEV